MKKDCRDVWEGVLALAQGKDSPAAQEHVSTCADCAEKLEQMKKVFESFGAGFFDAPAEVRSSAKDIFPARVPIVRARLVSSTFGAAQARSSVVDSFQLVFEAEDIQARMLYRQEARQWEVTGKVSGGDWRAQVGNKIISVDQDGRFTFRAKSLDETAITLVGSETEIDIPTAREATEGGS